MPVQPFLLGPFAVRNVPGTQQANYMELTAELKKPDQTENTSR